MLLGLRTARGRATWLLTAMALLGAGCSAGTPPTVVPGPEQVDAGQPPAMVANPGAVPPGALSSDPYADREGVSLVPVTSRPIFVFGHAVPVPVAQPASLRLAGLVRSSRRLDVTALPSPGDTAAVGLREHTRFDQHWGALSIPAQRQIIAAFAADPAMGKWLVLVTDVDVRGGPDPIPLTAYRWDRQAVEAYAACGIPPVEVDDCTFRFFVAGEAVLVRLSSGSDNKA